MKLLCFLFLTECTKGHMSFTPKENRREVVVIVVVVVVNVVIVMVSVVFIVYQCLAQKLDRLKNWEVFCHVESIWRITQ